MSLSAHQSGGGSLAQPQPAEANSHSPIMTAETVRQCEKPDCGHVGASLQLSAEKLRSIFAYDQETGIFTRRTAGAGATATPVGMRMGYVSHNGYVAIRVGPKMYGAHRLAWLYVHGEWPSVIDHINAIRTDNRIANLRNVDQRTNCENRRSANSSGALGVLGVSACGSRYRADIYVNGKARFLGVFSTIEEAKQRYIEEKRQVHRGCTL
jgi:hypothetical protein